MCQGFPNFQVFAINFTKLIFTRRVLWTLWSHVAELLLLVWGGTGAATNSDSQGSLEHFVDLNGTGFEKDLLRLSGDEMRVDTQQAFR